jgi:hypothetical protein
MKRPVLPEFLRAAPPRFLLSALLLASLAAPAAARWSLSEQPLWTVTPAERPYLSTGYNERGVAYNPATGHVLVVHAPGTDTVVVAILDGETGAHRGYLPVGGIEGGFERLRKIRVLDDGTIFAGNITTNARSAPYRLYRWVNETAEPELVWEGDPSAGVQGVITRYGDNLSARTTPGGEVEILVAPDMFFPRAFDVEPHVVALLTSTDGGLTFDNKAIKTEPTTRFGLGVDFGEGDTFLGTRYNQPLRQFDFEGRPLGTYGETRFPLRISPIRLDTSRGLLAGLRNHALELFQFPLSSEQFNSPFEVRHFPTSVTNNENTGDIAFGNNGVIYALHTNNGLAAWRLQMEAEDWMTVHGVPVGQRGLLDNPAGDGISNLMKYALGLHPLIPSPDGLPTAAVQTHDGEDYLMLAVEKNSYAKGVLYVVEISEDLVEWALDPQLIVLEENPFRLVVRDSRPIGEAERRFMRLRVLMP